jgi:hypothetical protein
VPKLGTRDTWQNHKVGPGDRQADTCRQEERSQHSVDFSRLGDSWIRARELTLQLAKWRVARSVKGRSTLADFQVSEVRTGRARRLNPSTCEVAKSTGASA